MVKQIGGDGVSSSVSSKVVTNNRFELLLLEDNNNNFDENINTNQSNLIIKNMITSKKI